MEDSKKSNKITEIVKLQMILKKWRKKATNNNTSTKNSTNANKSITFLKRTLSFSNTTTLSGGSGSFSGDTVPKGSVAVCVGEEEKRFIIPTGYLGHSAFALLLREAEEEFGFQQEGILRFPCEVGLFETILKVIEAKQDGFWLAENSSACGSSESSHLCQQKHHQQSPMCR